MDLTAYFNPRSIAIIGASLDIATINGKPLHYLTKHGYRGKIYPVNPKYDQIAGHRCYPNLAAIPGEVDLALVVVNYRLVPAILDQCVQKKVPFATVFSSGFAEAGEAGRKLQQQLTDMARRTGLHICGPNCQGAVDLHHQCAAAFSAALDRTPLHVGAIGFATQSGAMGYSIFNLLQENRIGCAYVASTGNEMDLDCLDFAAHMLEAPETRAVFAYMEGVKDGAKFVRTAERALMLGKPLAVLKVGRSEAGSRAAQSHTAALTGSGKVFDAFFHQKGVLAVNDIQEFVDLAQVIQGTAKIPRGRGIGVVSTSGGGGVICADAAEACGLDIVALQPATEEKIRDLIPAYGSAANPVDVTAQAINTAAGFGTILEAVAEDPGVDAVVAVLTNIVGEPGKGLARNIVELRKRTQKPVVAAWTAGETLMREQFAILTAAGVPLYISPGRALNALAKLMHYGTFRENRHRNQEEPQAGETQMAAPPANLLPPTEPARQVLTEHQSKTLLAHYGISSGRTALVQTADEACRAAEAIGFPLAMKVDSVDIPHKTEADAVRLDITDDRQVQQAFDDIMANARRHNPEARINGIGLAEMIPQGVEVIAGINHDPQFGPTILFGLGGIFVEVLKDVAVRLAPIDLQEAREMIAAIRGYGMLTGARGRAPADVEALARTLVNLSRMAVDLGDRLKEVDINPLMVLPDGQGVKVADALMIFDE